MKKSFFLLALLSLLQTSFAASAGDDFIIRPKRNRPVALAQTHAQRVARFQVKLNDELGLQPHQLCVLHHALLAQTDPSWPDHPAAGEPSITLREALRDVLRPDQMRILVRLPSRSDIAAESAELSVQL